MCWRAAAGCCFWTPGWPRAGAPDVAAILQEETGRDPQPGAFLRWRSAICTPLPGLSVDKGFGVCHNRGLRLKSVVA
jgi:hypothetical protein